ncbi:uncharacterized protein [Miscanthus floridulus]|uniref:uncharacterized protein isoform X1 n=1 Tax=Miscanthus floridulus TaxID=154761 RepID=UPI0034581602
MAITFLSRILQTIRGVLDCKRSSIRHCFYWSELLPPPWLCRRPPAFRGRAARRRSTQTAMAHRGSSQDLRRRTVRCSPQPWTSLQPPTEARPAYVFY